jgi:predicted transcriptional regulator of viral defense system
LVQEISSPRDWTIDGGKSKGVVPSEAINDETSFPRGYGRDERKKSYSNQLHGTVMKMSHVFTKQRKVLLFENVRQPFPYEASKMRGPEYIEHLRSRGRCTFTTDEVVDELEKSRDAANAFVRRLRDKGRVATPARGFHVVVPPEYRRLGCLPPQDFVPFLMDYLGRDYYAGLLTAAFFHGAAHQQPQAFQTLVDETRRDVQCGRVRIEFHERRSISNVPTESINTDYGQLTISTPEATAIDLIGYSSQLGGIDRAATVLTELGDDIDSHRLRELGPQIAPNAWLQRLGFLLDAVGHEDRTGPLAKYVQSDVREVAPLRPEDDGRSGRPRDQKWRIAVNHEVDPDL